MFWLTLTASYMTHFPVSSKSHPYTVITPDTALENLEDFFNQKGTDFALGQCCRRDSFSDLQ